MKVNLNLDQWAAQAAQQIVYNKGTIDPKRLFNVVNKGLGVLQSQGVYACMLYLYAEKDQQHASLIRQSLWDLLQRLEQEANFKWRNAQGEEVQRPQIAADQKNQRDTLSFFAEIVSSHLDTLLLVRELYEQTLIYARYHAKALGGNE